MPLSTPEVQRRVQCARLSGWPAGSDSCVGLARGGAFLDMRVGPMRRSVFTEEMGETEVYCSAQLPDAKRQGLTQRRKRLEGEDEEVP